MTISAKHPAKYKAWVGCILMLAQRQKTPSSFVSRVHSSLLAGFKINAERHALPYYCKNLSIFRLIGRN